MVLSLAMIRSTARADDALKLWYDKVDKVIQTVWQIWRHDVKAVCGIVHEPLFQLIGDLPRRTGYRAVTARAGNPLYQLPDRQPLAPRHIDQQLIAAFAGTLC